MFFCVFFLCVFCCCFFVVVFVCCCFLNLDKQTLDCFEKEELSFVS